MEHKIALVTGASSGIGEALCYRLAREGLKLIICGRNEDRLTALSQNLPAGIVLKIIASDLLLREGREQVIAAIHSYVPDLVINNAGFGYYGNALTYTTADQAAILEVNGMAVLELTLEAARTLQTKGRQGVILNVSSIASFLIFPDSAVYSASKAFVTSFSQSIDLEVERFGIRVLTSCPGMVATEFSNRAGTGADPRYSPLIMCATSVAEEIWEQIKKLQPLRIIDWKYRILLFFTNLLPKRWFALELQKNLQNRIGPRKFIEVNNDITGK